MSIPLFKIYWDDNDVRAVDSVIKRGSSWACGPEISAFEKKISDYMGVKHCIIFNSGTSALHASLMAHGIKSGDEVIVPSFTFIATANAPLFLGAKPVFADIEEENMGLDPSNVEEKITKRTKAIIPVHYSGCPCKINEIKKIADEHSIALIEDAAEAMGAKVAGKMAGSFGGSAVLSFCQNKIITTGEGGAVITDDSKLYEKMLLTRSHGREEGEYFSSSKSPGYTALGYNFRVPSMVAALGVSQINKIEKIIRMRIAAADYYKKKLSGISGITIPAVPKDFRHVYQMFTVRVENAALRDKLVKHLERSGIASKVYFEPVHLSEFYRKSFGRQELPVTEKISGEVLSLPMHPALSKEEIDCIAEKINKFFN
ncbi:MAG: DegT/DnrJ/EryC1/StrS family aminotransferase [Candidatus Aenigmarchaeota archaeon]|nr:DegT/DnrJ/EryC1/StrS family aminotransferase [Candidatus Aenigmarchaeota archaeon]